MNTQAPPPDRLNQMRPRTYAIRLSTLDIAVVVTTVVASPLLYRAFGSLALVVPYVVAHFFLFCNVFRIRRKPELIWATLFLVNTAVWVFWGAINVTGILGVPLIATVAIIAVEIRKPHYHGIAARRLNARLDDYLAGKHSSNNGSLMRTFVSNAGATTSDRHAKPGNKPNGFGI